MKRTALYIVAFMLLATQSMAQDSIIDTVFHERMNIELEDGSIIPYDISNVKSVSFDIEEEIRISNIIDITPEIYDRQPTEEEVTDAIAGLNAEFGMAQGGRYCLRGGKEGAYPGEHAYQQQYSLGPDLYAQYFTVPHYDFMYGTLTSTYDISAEYNSGPLGAYTRAKEAFMPLLTSPMVNNIPEIKAVNLLFYCLAAQENADLSGPYTYIDDQKNTENPKNYNDLRTIYYSIVDYLDNIVACLKNYEDRPEWYKEMIGGVLERHHDTNRRLFFESDYGFDTYIRLANSLKLRMAMHIVKVEPQTAKRWAEEAVASGVIERVDEQQGIFPIFLGFIHPLVHISNGWGDLRLCASFESLLMSLDHPYTKYLFLPNSYDITNEKTGKITPAGTRLCGIRAGTLVGEGQIYSMNQRQAYSTFDSEKFFMSPLYFIKWAEVDFLRAEGALRGWDMGGSAQDFYERGIRNAFVEDPRKESEYCNYVDYYMQLAEPVDYIQTDPMGDGSSWPSVTKIGVKWNDADNNETKLEKIITQKYIALFPLSTEAWTELRRTGYPKLFPVLNPDDGDGSIMNGDMIRRIPWVPKDSKVQDIINRYAIPALGGPDKQATRLWWDVDKPNF